MREIIHDVRNWDGPIALATVVSTWGSAPRRVGAKLAMTTDNRLAGSVSGGCIEGAVYEEGQDALQSNRARLLSYGVADETAFEAIGLACGGNIEVFVEPLTAQLRAFWLDAADHERACVTATVIAGAPDDIGYKLLLNESGNAQTSQDDARYNGLTAQLLSIAGIALRTGKSTRMTLPDGATQVFVDVQLPTPQLVLFGAVHIALALAPIARAVGFRVVVCDPRPAFGNRERFPDVDALITEYPDKAFKQLLITRSTAIVTLSHDSKFDDPALFTALQSDAFYVGALGGLKTREQRRARLIKRGLTEQQADRLHAPLGLDLGATTPEEIALAAMAQIVSARNKIGAAR